MHISLFNSHVCTNDILRIYIAKIYCVCVRSARLIQKACTACNAQFACKFNSLTLLHITGRYNNRHLPASLASYHTFLAKKISRMRDGANLRNFHLHIDRSNRLVSKIKRQGCILGRHNHILCSFLLMCRLTILV